MKALSASLVLCTLIVCASIYALPFLTKQRELALAEKVQAAAERNVSLTVILASPESGPASHRGLRIEP